MIIKFVYKILPAFVTYTDKIGERDGKIRFMFIMIHPKHKDNTGLLIHELTHVKQLYRTFFIHGLLYKISKKYRLRAEIEAYSAQIKYDGVGKIPLDAYINLICTKYNLNVDPDTVRQMFKERGIE